MAFLNKTNRAKWRGEKPAQAGRKEEADGFYQSAAWKKVRRVYIKNNPLCASCYLPTPASVVDHITPIRLGGDKLNFSNLQALCVPCHAKKSGSERHSKGVGGSSNFLEL
jgi:5-methylcytosine-specific restriction enzyme A